MVDSASTAPVFSLTAEEIRFYVGLVGIALTSGIGIFKLGKSLLKHIRIFIVALIDEAFKVLEGAMKVRRRWREAAAADKAHAEAIQKSG